MFNQLADHKSFVFDNQHFAWKQFETVLQWNAQTFAAYTTIASEVQGFIARRVNEDFGVVRTFSQCRTPDDLMAAYTEYWRNVAEDYGKEVTRVGKLMANATSKIVSAAHPGTHREATPVRWREAAE